MLTINRCKNHIIKCIVAIFLIKTAFFNVYSQKQDISLVVIGTKDTCIIPFQVKVKINQSTNNVAYFEWDFKDGTPVINQLVSQMGDTIIHTYTQYGTFALTVTGFDNFGNPRSQGGAYIYVGRPDKALMGINPLISCDGNVSFQDTSQRLGIPTDTMRTIFWDFGDGTSTSIFRSISKVTPVNHTYVLAGDTSYNVKMRITNQCGSDSSITSVRITKFNPSINFSVPACRGADIQFSNPDQKLGVAYNYLWDFGDGSATSTLDMPTHSYNAAGNFLVKMNVSIQNGNAACSGMVTQNVTVLNAPDTKFTLDYVPACDSFVVSTNNASIGADKWLWNFGNGITSNSKDSSVKYINAGSYNISLTATDNATQCKITATETLVVPAKPIANYIATSVCQGSLATFSDLSTIKFGTIKKWNWDFGDGTGSIMQNVTHTFNTNGIMNVRLIISEGNCKDTIVKSLLISPKPQAGFTPMNFTGCPPLAVTFVHQPDINAVAYQWSFGDGGTSNSADTIYKYQNAFSKDTVYKVRMIATSLTGCSDTAFSTVTVYRPPVADFISNIKQKPDCGPDTVLFNAKITGIIGTSFQWNFDDGSPLSTLASPTHVFRNDSLYPRYYNIKLIAISPAPFFCRDTSDEKVLTIYPKPSTDFLIDTIKLCPPALFNLWAPPASKAIYVWDLGNGVRFVPTSNKQSQLFQNQTSSDLTYNVKLITYSEFGCSDSTIKSLVIPASPNAGFTVQPALVQNYPNTTFGFQNLSINHPTWEYKWNFGDRSDTIYVYAPQTYSYQSWGRYNVMLSVKNANGCSDDTLQQLSILPPPAVPAITKDLSNGCAPLTVSFKDISYATDTTANRWDFGDGTFASGTAASHTFYKEGRIRITLYSKDLNGSDLAVDTFIVVFKKPSASFTVVPQNPEVGLDPVYGVPNYPDTTDGSERYFWDFGDGSTYNSQKPRHIYNNTGAYDVTLTVTSVHNCINSDTIEHAVMPVVSGKVSFPNAFMPRMTGSSGNSIDQNTTENFIFLPFSSGVEQYKLEIYNRWGELLFSSANRDQGWDGYYKGRLCKQDVYVWKVIGKFASGKAFNKAGNVTLLHSRN